METFKVNVNIIYSTYFDIYIFYLSTYNELLDYLKFVLYTKKESVY